MDRPSSRKRRDAGITFPSNETITPSLAVDGITRLLQKQGIVTTTKKRLRHASNGLQAPPTDKSSIAAHWPLDEERGKKITDVSGNERHGTIVNLGTWMTGGPSFDATKIGRYDTAYDFDVITNLDLHRDPDLLGGYKTLIINGHDEY